MIGSIGGCGSSVVEIRRAFGKGPAVVGGFEEVAREELRLFEHFITKDNNNSGMHSVIINKSPGPAASVN